MSIEDGCQRVFVRAVDLFGPEHAITFVLLADPAIASTLDASLGSAWRLRADGRRADVPSEDEITRLLDAVVARVGHDGARQVLEHLDWRATRAFERRFP